MSGLQFPMGGASGLDCQESKSRILNEKDILTLWIGQSKILNLVLQILNKLH